MTDRPYMVIYPGGDRSRLDVAYVRWYQKDEWDLASRREFATEAEAKEYALRLSKNHGIPVAFQQSGILD